MSVLYTNHVISYKQPIVSLVISKQETIFVMKIIKTEKDMQKFIRIALPWVCSAVMVWYLFFDGADYLGWNGLIDVVGIGAVGAVCIAVLYVKLHKLQKQKEEHLCLLKKQAEEAVAPELEKVNGNSLKKEMIKRRLVREYIEKNSDNCSEENIAIENTKDWLSLLKWSFGIIIAMPMLLIIILFVVAVGLFVVGFGLSDGTGVPTQVDYHNADDLQKVTGVEFPEVIPVDSFYSDRGLASYETQIKFVPAKPLNKDFFYRLDQACKTDSCCWRKDSIGYFYDIHPEAIPFDRTKGMHRRMVEDVDGKKVPDWDGTYISVFVPIKGDTIILSDGWTR